MDTDFIAKAAAGIAALGGGLYAFLRMFKSDRREDKVVELSDDTLTKVIQTLRDEVDRLTKRLEKVEEENRKCEERNTELHLEIVQLKKQLHLA